MAKDGDYNQSAGRDKISDAEKTGLKTQKGKGAADNKGDDQKSAGRQPLGERMKELIARGLISSKAANKKFAKGRRGKTGASDDDAGQQDDDREI